MDPEIETPPSDARSQTLLRQTIEDFQACEVACLHAATHCLAQGGRYAQAELLHALWDCADFCSIAVRLLIRGSVLQEIVCALCADACEQAAARCQGLDDNVLSVCAEICASSAEGARQLAGSDSLPQQIPEPPQ